MAPQAPPPPSVAHLPTPGQLVVENVDLLAGSPTAFRARYGHLLTPTTFSKPGATAQAAAVLHFLLCVIDADTARAAFKPCFPILDREQERDFRRAVDARLAALEKSKLLPVGAARKSVVASAGGDRFLDLLWSLSSLAVQQACLRHPPYGPVSRLRLMSLQMRSDSNLSHQSSARSARSALSSAPAPRPDRQEPSRPQRRFLGVGMVAAAQQRAKDAEDMRARIDSERAALARTAGLAHSGEKTWASEADSLREKIGEFEAKVRRLKGQLADMGFDENGVDIRSLSAEKRSDGQRDDATDGKIPQSSSGEDLGEVLKTSPIESMESGSSVDELPEPADGCDDIAADLSRLLTFASDTREMRAEVDRVLPAEKHVVRVPSGSGKDSFPGGMDGFSPAKPEDIVDLVRAATDELEQATNRMDEIQEARRKAQGIESPIDSSEGTLNGNDSDKTGKEILLGTLVHSALAKHKEVVESSRHLQVEATKLTEQSQNGIKSLPHTESDNSLRDKDLVATISKPTWLTEATADASKNSLTDQKGATESSGPTTTSQEVDTAKDVRLLAQAMQPTPYKSPRSPRSTSSSRSGSRRRNERTRSTEPRHMRSRSTASTSRDSFDPSLNSPASSMASRNARTVHFAALPPSYSGKRSVAPHSYASRQRLTRCSTEVFPKSSRSVLSQDLEDDGDTASVGGKSDLSVSSVDPSRSVDLAKAGARRVPVSKMDAPVAARNMAHRRVHSVDEKLELSRGGAVAGGMPTRVQRTQTPRRLVRQKEAIQRAAMRPPTYSGRALSASSKKLTSPPAKSENTELDALAVRVEETAIPAVDSPHSANDTSSGAEQAEDAGTSNVVKPEVEKTQSGDIASFTTETSVDQHMDTVPKRLFATPEPSSASSSNRRGFSNTFVRRAASSKNVASAVQGSKKSMSRVGLPAFGRDRGRVSIPMSPKGSSILLSSTDDDELLFSPAPSGVLNTAAKPPSGAKAASGAGFFAGETAQWQKNVRSRSTVAGQGTEVSERKTTVESSMSSGSPMKSSSRGTSSSRKTRMQSLKARLAAALK